MGKIKTKEITQKTVNAINDNIMDEINSLKEQIKNLENKIYKYKVGDLVLYKDLRVVKITKLVKNRYDYLYQGDFQIGSKDVFFEGKDIIGKYNPWSYMDTLQDALLQSQSGKEFVYQLDEWDKYKRIYKSNFILPKY